MSLFFIIIIISEPRQHCSITAGELFVIVQDCLPCFLLKYQQIKKKMEREFRQP